MASIRTADLTKDFGDLRAVNEIDLDLPEGGVAGFVGPNGAVQQRHHPDAVRNRTGSRCSPAMLLVTWSAVLAGRLPRALNALGMVVGVAGVLTVVPALEVLGIGFSLGEIVWGVWLGIVLLRGSRSAAAQGSGALMPRHSRL